MTVLSRLLCRSPAVSCTSTSDLDAAGTTSRTLVSTGVVRDVMGVEGVVCSAVDNIESLALTTNNHIITDALLAFPNIRQRYHSLSYKQDPNGLTVVARKRPYSCVTETSIFPKQKQQQQQSNTIKYRMSRGTCALQLKINGT